MKCNYKKSPTLCPQMQRLKIDNGFQNVFFSPLLINNVAKNDEWLNVRELEGESVYRSNTTRK